MATKRKDKSRVVLKTGEVQRKDGTYQFSWQDSQMKRRFVYARTLDDLREKEKRIQKDKCDGIKTEARYTTIDELFDLWANMKRGLKNNTFENYKYMYNTFVRPVIGSKRISTLKKSDIKKYYNYLVDERNLKPSTIDNIHTVLHQVLQIAVDDDFIRNNPSDNVLRELKKAHCFQSEKRRALTKLEQELFLNFMKTHPVYEHWYPVFAVMIGTGLRVGEVTGLRWCDIDMESGMIDVNHTLVYYDHRTEGSKSGCYFNVNTTKTPASMRQVPMLGFVREAFEQEKQKQEDLGLHCEVTIDGYTDFNFITLDNPKKELKEGKNIRKNISKFLSFPYQKIRKIIKLPILYRESYHFADKVILLSSHFKKPFLEYSHLKDDSKIRIIHNALSFHSFYDLANYNHKKKEVLIVSRLEEEPKRISLALKIWKEIETDHTLSEWKLKIVGHGKMESWYKSLVIHYGLQRVFFEGTKNPEPYYNEASIFMMTSSFEGWGLTLTEAQQYGCVPLAFHSFASLTDIITDKVNGFAIPNDDISLYIKQMKLLMTDEKLRKSMSANAIESSKQFSIEIIIKKWMEVINE